jgi:hypothetical protein
MLNGLVCRFPNPIPDSIQEATHDKRHACAPDQTQGSGGAKDDSKYR